MSIFSNKEYIKVFNSGNLFFPSIFSGICDSPDLCHEDRCEFYDDSGEANEKFLDAYCLFCEQIDKKVIPIKPPDFCPLLKRLVVEWPV